MQTYKGHAECDQFDKEGEGTMVGGEQREKGPKYAHPS